MYFFFEIDYRHPVVHFHLDFFFVHAFKMPIDVHLLLGLVHTERTRELWLFAALPFLMVSQRRFQLIKSAAFGTRVTLAVLRFAVGRLATVNARIFRLLLL